MGLLMVIKAIVFLQEFSVFIFQVSKTVAAASLSDCLIPEFYLVSHLQISRGFWSLVVPMVVPTMMCLAPVAPQRCWIPNFTLLWESF